MNTEIKDMTTCPGCDKHCPVGQFQCGKGNRIFGQADTGAEADREHRKHHEHGEGAQHRHGRQHHDREEHSGLEGHRGHHHGARNEKKWWAAENSDDLAMLLGKCGHYFAKHSGRGHGQDKILRILAEEQSISQRGLQEILDIKPGSISEILSKLEDKELILREKSETDKRAVIIRVTEKGKAAVAKKTDRRSDEDLFNCLGEDEKETLRVLLKKLLTAWHRQ